MPRKNANKNKKLPAQKVNAGKGGGKPKALSKAPAKPKPMKSVKTGNH